MGPIPLNRLLMLQMAYGFAGIMYNVGSAAGIAQRSTGVGRHRCRHRRGDANFRQRDTAWASSHTDSRVLYGKC